MTEHTFQQLVFHFRNGDEWTVAHDELADIWISRVTTSYGRINGGQIQEIHPCKSFRVEVLPQADHVKSSDINTGSLELGMFGRATKYQDIERMDLVFDADRTNQIYFPFTAKDPSGLDNAYQTSQVDPISGHLFIVIDPDHTVKDIYTQLQ
ncbi:hypothetical protein ACFQ5J_11475 [Lacticaseibacillus baoqingensis]|uniref:Uncharacterized protein n=1 Tax=Lacticaseibacillus baoqingensis TaxID=2486013 RepID=A0ABW4EAX6_9LACO|nr:hypothetical protein [Lacticaseibacillus baoqingensis]